MEKIEAMIVGLTNYLRPKRNPIQSCGAIALLLGLYLVSVATLAEGSSPRMRSSLPYGATADFAIADFDGDQQPDLATVQAGRSTLHESHYWISFELSSGSQQTIGLTAPIGGLHLDSRDVNGDHLADLIVSTAWFGRTVAILLNDGHGKFTLVDPSAFPAAIHQSNTAWSEPSPQMNDIPAVPPSRFLPKVLRARATRCFAGDDRGPASLATARIYVLKRTANTSGRAPPPSVLHV